MAESVFANASRQKRMAFSRSSLSLLGGAQAAARSPPRSWRAARGSAWYHPHRSPRLRERRLHYARRLPVCCFRESLSGFAPRGRDRYTVSNTSMKNRTGQSSHRTETSPRYALLASSWPPRTPRHPPLDTRVRSDAAAPPTHECSFLLALCCPTRARGPHPPPHSPD